MFARKSAIGFPPPVDCSPRAVPAGSGFFTDPAILRGEMSGAANIEGTGAGVAERKASQSRRRSRKPGRSLRAGRWCWPARVRFDCLLSVPVRMSCVVPVWRCDWPKEANSARAVVTDIDRSVQAECDPLPPAAVPDEAIVICANARRYSERFPTTSFHVRARLSREMQAIVASGRQRIADRIERNAFRRLAARRVEGRPARFSHFTVGAQMALQQIRVRGPECGGFLSPMKRAADGFQVRRDLAGAQVAVAGC